MRIVRASRLFFEDTVAAGATLDLPEPLRGFVIIETRTRQVNGSCIIVPRARFGRAWLMLYDAAVNTNISRLGGSQLVVAADAPLTGVEIPASCDAQLDVRVYRSYMRVEDIPRGYIQSYELDADASDAVVAHVEDVEIDAQGVQTGVWTSTGVQIWHNGRYGAWPPARIYVEVVDAPDTVSLMPGIYPRGYTTTSSAYLSQPGAGYLMPGFRTYTVFVRRPGAYVLRVTYYRDAYTAVMG